MGFLFLGGNLQPPVDWFINHSLPLNRFGHTPDDEIPGVRKFLGSINISWDDFDLYYGEDAGEEMG